MNEWMPLKNVTMQPQFLNRIRGADLIIEYSTALSCAIFFFFCLHYGHENKGLGDNLGFLKWLNT